MIGPELLKPVNNKLKCLIKTRTVVFTHSIDCVLVKSMSNDHFDNINDNDEEVLWGYIRKKKKIWENTALS